jgi:hypothetical protein
VERGRFSLYASAVDPKALLSELLCACRTLGLGIRDEPMKVPATRLAGGLVRLRGVAVVIVDSAAPAIDRVAAVADALSELAIASLQLSADACRAIALARQRRQHRHFPMRRIALVALWKEPKLSHREVLPRGSPAASRHE